MSNLAAASNRRVGIWLIGAYGGVAATMAAGLAALRRGLTATTGLVTALPHFSHLDLDSPANITLGGHDIRRSSLLKAAQELHDSSNVIAQPILDAISPDLDTWSANVRPGTILNAGPTIADMADRPDLPQFSKPADVISHIQKDLRDFQARHGLEQVVMVNVASTEPHFTPGPEHDTWERLREALDQPGASVLPASGLYAYAALDLGWPYVNFTPSVGSDTPALHQLALLRRAVHCGKDGKTGETLMKSVLAPMFAARNLRIMSWVGHNIFGNRDGQVLNNPVNKESKVRTKDALIQQIVGYKPQTLVTIEYIESMGDWKTAWDHIHFEGFLGTKMTLQFIWQGCDSLLAGPLAIDLARLALLSARRGEIGVLSHLACFFKSPVGEPSHDFFQQFARLEEYAARIREEKP